MDLIDDLNEMLMERGIESTEAMEISEQIRQRHAGQVYIRRRSETIQETIGNMLRQNGRCEEIARKFSVSKRTIYRIMNRNRRHK